MGTYVIRVGNRREKQLSRKETSSIRVENKKCGKTGEGKGKMSKNIRQKELPVSNTYLKPH